MMEEGELEVNWEGTYEEVRSDISKLFREAKYKEAKEETKKIRKIPLEERVKIVKSKSEVIGKIRGATEVEAIRKYVNNEADQQKCLKILEDIREGKMKIKHCSEDYRSEKKRNNPLLKAAKQAIDSNDLPSLIPLSKGCFLPSAFSILYDHNIKYGDLYCSLFEYSCRIYAIDCALYLLEVGGGIEQGFEKGYKPLHQSLMGGNEEIEVFLIERGADCKARADNDYNALHAASIGNCFEVLKILIERGYNIEKRTEFGRTPLHLAAFENSYEVAKLLIERGADIEAKDNREETPLNKAAKSDSIAIAKLLIVKGADIEAKNDDGNTPLHIAAVFDSPEVAQILIERGADIEAKNEDGDTPLHTASWSDNYDVAKLLIERGADIEVKNKNEQTPLQEAESDQIRDLITEAAKCKKYDLYTYVY